MSNYTKEARDKYNANRDTVTVAGRVLDMTNGNDFRVFTAALVHGSDVMITDYSGYSYSLSIRDEYKAKLAKEQSLPAGWWDVWTTLNGARFAEGQSRGGMGTSLIRERVAQLSIGEAA